ncbi:MAG: hypothetical protein LZF60_280063 [Nitrospira sp.]|nr:MAG: hypothetical protein LZF60_280063 [Nitrospira sp.]
MRTAASRRHSLFDRLATCHLQYHFGNGIFEPIGKERRTRDKLNSNICDRGQLEPTNSCMSK